MEKKKTFANYKKVVHDIIKEAKYVLLISHWNIDIYFMKNDDEDGAVATTDIGINGIRYYNSSIRFFPQHFELYKDKDDYKFVQSIIHELCHIIIEPVYLIALDSVTNTSQKHLETLKEQTVEQIANIVYNLWKTVKYKLKQ